MEGKGPNLAAWWGEKFRHTEGRYAGCFPPAWVDEGDERASDRVPPEERCLTLTELADAIVRGASIRHAAVPDLRALIEPVQAHPNAKVAKIGPDGKPDIDEPTPLVIRGGEVLTAQLSDLDIGVRLTVGVHFAGAAGFYGASFAGAAGFEGASFAGAAGFGWASFAGDARFERASFAGHAWFVEASFARDAWFLEASFAEVAGFERASFADAAWFERASFTGAARFGRASFAGDAWFERASFTGAARFGGAQFALAVDGDLRGVNVRTAQFAEVAADNIELSRLTEIQPPLRRVRRVLRWCFARPTRSVIRWPSRIFGWRTVRGLGHLAILNRVSLVALIAVPALAAAWPVLQGALPTDIHIVSRSMALTFFAAVAVTLGLLVYQLGAPDDIKKDDEDGFVDRMHKRYPEDAKDRNDGLRRAIEQLEEIAKVRPDRHKSFVKHHGDTIWIPPREKVEWYQDPPEPDPKPSPQPAAAVNPGGQVPSDPAKALPSPKPASDREGFVPGAERARITIEEGARAEYWLKSRQSIGAAWLSFGLYLLGVGCLLVILVIQMWSVGRAAGWWGRPDQTARQSAGEAAPAPSTPDAAPLGSKP